MNILNETCFRYEILCSINSFIYVCVAFKPEYLQVFTWHPCDKSAMLCLTVLSLVKFPHFYKKTSESIRIRI